MRQGEIFDWLRKCQKEGKIKSFGASVESMEEAPFVSTAGLRFALIIFNIFRQKPIVSLFPHAKEKEVAIIVRLPLASGSLSGKINKDTKFAATDHRSYNRDGQQFSVGETFAGLPFEKGVELAEDLKDFVPQALTMAQFAQRWILDHEEVSVIIPGATSADQARANASISEFPPLSPPLHERLANYYQGKVYPFIRGPY